MTNEQLSITIGKITSHDLLNASFIVVITCRFASLFSVRMSVASLLRYVLLGALLGSSSCGLVTVGDALNFLSKRGGYCRHYGFHG
jgi:ABC-type transport system involved in cytochrome c biogenesis permease component